VSSRRTAIGRVAERISVVTSQIFRCQGLDHVSPGADRLGTHDVFYWLVFTAAISGWYLFHFAPQRERLQALNERRHTLDVHLREESRELRRLTRGIRDLTANDPTAWERAARGKLGWLEPGELTDMVKWSRNRVVPVPPVRPRTEASNRQPQDQRRPAPAPALERPSVPALPVPPDALRSAGLRLDTAPSIEDAVAARRRLLQAAPRPPELPSAPQPPAFLTESEPPRLPPSRPVARSTGSRPGPPTANTRVRR